MKKSRRSRHRAPLLAALRLCVPAIFPFSPVPAPPLRSCGCLHLLSYSSQSAKSQRLATAAWDGKIYIFDSISGSLIHTIREGRLWLRRAATSFDFSVRHNVFTSATVLAPICSRQDTSSLCARWHFRRTSSRSSPAAMTA